jgi:hypothetical protein
VSRGAEFVSFSLTLTREKVGSRPVRVGSELKRDLAEAAGFIASRHTSES